MYPKLVGESFLKKNYNFYELVCRDKNLSGVVIINKSAFEILQLCNGQNSLKTIKSNIHNKYKSDPDSNKFVHTFITDLINNNILKDEYEEKNINIIKGSSEFFCPESLCWEITDFCPLNCRHCYLSEKNAHHITDSQIETVLNVIDKLGIISVQITGGDPLSHPKVGEILNKLNQRNVSITLSTSGTYYPQNVFDYLKILSKNGNALRVSLDGSRNTHNFNRNNPKAYDKSIHFIKKALQLGIAVQASTTVINQDIEELSELVEVCKNLGVSYIEFGPLLISGNAKENALTTRYNALQVEEIALKLSEKYADSNFSIQLPSHIKTNNCGAGHKIICITPQMDVTPCPMLDFKMGNLSKQSIEQIMKNSVAFGDLKSPNLEICNSCEYKNSCRNCTATGIINKEHVKHCKWYAQNQELFCTECR